MAEIFTALEPAGLAATVKAIDEAEAARADRLRLFEATVERTRYEAERARRQHDACEPENRLVARSLEAAWEQRLNAVAEAEAALAAERAGIGALSPPRSSTGCSERALTCARSSMLPPHRHGNANSSCARC
jgi:hypothetical protein